MPRTDALPLGTVWEPPPPTRRATAIHEAAHAVFAWRHHVMLRGPATIEPAAEWLGIVPLHRQTWPGSGDGARRAPEPLRAMMLATLQRHVDADVEIALAGPLAERRHRRIRRPRSVGRWLPGAGPSSDPGSDLGGALAALREWLGDGFDDTDCEWWLDVYAERVARLLRHVRTWAAVEAVAAALEARRTLGPEKVEGIIERVNPPRLPVISRAEMLS